MRAQGHVLIAVLVVMGALATVWMAEFAIQLEDRIRAQRLIDRESQAVASAAAEWQAVTTQLQSLAHHHSPAQLVYQVDDSLGQREVTLVARWTDEQWQFERVRVQWRRQLASP